jgi:hypothetical protein
VDVLDAVRPTLASMTDRELAEESVRTLRRIARVLERLEANPMARKYVQEITNER